MSDSKDETGKAAAGPAEAGAGKRPYATLDLQATEVAGKDEPATAKRPEPDAKSGGPSPADNPSAFSSAARSASALAAHVQSGSFLSHVGAGVVGALLVGLLGYLLLPLSKIDPQGGVDTHDLARRVADTEAVLGAQSGDSHGLMARVDDLVRSVRSLDEAQGRLASQAKELQARLGDGQAGTAQELPPDLAARLTKLEQSMSAQSGTQAGEAAAKASMAAVDRELAGIRTDAGRLSQRVDSLRGDLEERLRGAARTSDVASLESKLANLSTELQAVQKTEGDRSANAARALLSLELASLKRVMDRGEPFANELAAVRRASAGKLDLKPLESYMREGVPTLADINKSFRKIADAMQDAEAVPPDASLVDRLLSGARSIVRVRKAGHSADDTSLEATIARMDTALKDNHLAEVLEQGKLLPPKAALAAEDWLRQVEARNAVDRAIAGIEDAIKSSLAVKPAGTEPRQ
jgi:hypothetical protein